MREDGNRREVDVNKDFIFAPRSFCLPKCEKTIFVVIEEPQLTLSTLDSYCHSIKRGRDPVHSPGPNVVFMDVSVLCTIYT